jgi:hypothetical protein
MANSNGWGDGAANNTIGWGQAANNLINWGKSHFLSWAGLTDIVGITTPPPPAFDPDAQAFITATAITDTTQQNAIDALVIGLKTDLLWNKMLAVYPFVGGTATTCKFNLKNPVDTDLGHRLTFVGGWTFSNNGIQGNGTNAYANTYLTPSVHWSFGNSSLSHYSRTNSVATGTPYGTKTGGFISSIYLALSSSGGTSIFHQSNSGTSPFPGLTTTALNLIQSRINSSNTIVAVNGTTASYANGELSISNHPIYIGARNNNNTSVDLYYTREMAFAHIGTGLTQAECTLLYNRIQTFQTTLGRQV